MPVSVRDFYDAVKACKRMNAKNTIKAENQRFEAQIR
jgi:hypothetical protein